MKISDFLREETIFANLKSTNKPDVIAELAKPLSTSASIDIAELIRILTEREKLGSTGIGGGIGIPHGKVKFLESNIILGFGLSKKGIDFDSMDGLPVHIFFMLITAEISTSLHLKVLAGISKMLRTGSFKRRLMNAADKEDIINIIKEFDEDF